MAAAECCGSFTLPGKAACHKRLFSEDLLECSCAGVPKTKATTGHVAHASGRESRLAGGRPGRHDDSQSAVCVRSERTLRSVVCGSRVHRMDSSPWDDGQADAGIWWVGVACRSLVHCRTASNVVLVVLGGAVHDCVAPPAAISNLLSRLDSRRAPRGSGRMVLATGSQGTKSRSARTMPDMRIQPRRAHGRSALPGMWHRLTRPTPVTAPPSDGRIAVVGWCHARSTPSQAVAGGDVGGWRHGRSFRSKHRNHVLVDLGRATTATEWYLTSGLLAVNHFEPNPPFNDRRFSPSNPPRWIAEYHPFRDLTWRPYFTRTSRAFILHLPLWIPTATVGELFAWAWWRDRAWHLPGACRKCGYDLGCLAADARCPECGTASPTPSP